MKLKYWFGFIGLGLAWGSSFFWNKLALQEIGPFTLVAIRLLLGLIGMLGGILVRRPKLPKTRREWLMVGLLGLTNTAIPFSLISWSQQHIDSTVVSVLVSSVPIFTVIMAHFLIKEERMDPKKLIGILVGFFGVVVMFWRGIVNVGGMSLAGQLGVLGASSLFAISAIIARRETSKVDPLIQSFFSLVIADLAMWLVVLATEPDFRMPTEPTTWGALLWLGIVGSALAYHIYYFLIGNIGPTRTSLVTYLMPVVGLLLGVLLLGERFDLQLLVGSVLVLGSIWVVNRLN
jgi:drug/metabolite transporter (DMT)-like permease